MTLRLFILEPAVIFTAQVDETEFTYPIASVDFDGGTALGTVLEGYTVHFGSAAGGDNRGRQRVRAGSTIGSTGTLNIGRSSIGVMDGEINIENDSHITIYGLRSVWMRAPYIDDDGVIFKDHDIAYSDQNEEPPPVANAGIGFCRSVAAGGSTISCDFDGSASFAVADGASISSYLWDVDDGNITTGTSASAQITASFPAGFRYVSLTVTDSNGKTHAAYVPVYARDPANDTTVQNFYIEQHTITPDGQEMAFRILDDLPAADYPNGTLVMLWEDEPSSNSDRSHMRFIGWHMTDPASIRAERTGTLRDTTLVCGDVGAMLKRLPGFPVEILGADSPANWGQMTAPNMDKYLHYLLHWHSTALELADWTDTGTGSDYPFVILGSDGESLWDQVQSKAKALVPDYLLTVNRRGQMQTVADSMLLGAGGRPATVQKALDAGDIRDISWTAQNFPRIHWLRGEAIVAHASTINAVFCIAPGTAPGQGLAEQTSGEQLTQTQGDLNAVEGHRYARLNAPNSYFNILLAGSDDFDIEPADLTWVTVTLPASVAAQRGLTLSAERGLVREMNITYEGGRTGLVKNVELVWEQETEGEPAVTEIPPIVDDPPDDPGGDDWPGGDDDPPPIGWNTRNICAVNTDGYQYVTGNFNAPGYQGGPTWTRDDLGLSGDLLTFTVDPFSPLYIGTGATVNYWVATTTNIYYVEDCFGVSGGPTVNDQHTFTHSTASSTLRDGNPRTIEASFGNYFSNTAWVVCVSNYRDVSGHTGVWATYTQDGGQNWSSEVQITAHYDTSGNFWRAPGLYVSPKTAGLARTSAPTVTQNSPPWDFFQSTDYGATWALQTNPNPNPGDAGGALHVPWPDNANETVTYHSWLQTFPGVFGLRRVNADGSISDITPQDGSGRTYGSVYHGVFGIKTFDKDRRYVCVAGYEQNGNLAVFVSDDYGDSWTLIHGPSSSDPVVVATAFGQDTHRLVLMWGTSGYIALSTDFGGTIDDRRGNIPTSFPGAGTFVGIAGGG